MDRFWKYVNKEAKRGSVREKGGGFRQCQGNMWMYAREIVGVIGGGLREKYKGAAPPRLSDSKLLPGSMREVKSWKHQVS